MFKQLQTEHAAWALKNFGEQDIESYKLGLIDEVGELAHSVLKRKQGIRNNENHEAKIRDAVGDITIYLVGFCNCAGVEVEYSEFKHDPYRPIGPLQLSEWLHNIFDYGTDYVPWFVTMLREFCSREGIDYEQTVKETWVNVVSKRDWKNNPDQVAAERLAKYCDPGCQP